MALTPQKPNTDQTMLERHSDTLLRQITISEFLDWCAEKHHLELKSWDNPHRVSTSNKNLIAEFVGVDLEQLERERAALLQDIQDQS